LINEEKPEPVGGVSVEIYINSMFVFNATTNMRGNVFLRDEIDLQMG
jgi:hypothetical protein